MVVRMRSTKGKRNNRRAHHKITPASTYVCDHCKEPKLPHRMCANCGYYRGRQVIDLESKAASKAKKKQDRIEAVSNDNQE